MHTPLLRYGRRQEAPISGAPALAARELVVRYPGVAAPALAQASVEVPVGACAALIGPNGSGKSTLLKTAAGLLRPAAGLVTVFGRQVGECRERVAYLPQRGELDWRFPISVRRLVMTGRYVRLGWLRRPGRADHEAVDAALARVGLGDLARRQIGRLSGGQQQRLLLARALAQGADLLLLDEPLNAVDAATRAAVLDVIAELRREGKTCVVATHDLSLLETGFDQIIDLGETAHARSPSPLMGGQDGRRLSAACDSSPHTAPVRAPLTNEPLGEIHHARIRLWNAAAGVPR